MESEQKLKEHTYYVSGMHCASCEILIEKKLLDLPEVKSVEASLAKNQVLVEYKGQKLAADQLTKLFKKEKYVFSESAQKDSGNFSLKRFFSSFLIAAAIIAAFLLLNQLGLAELVNVSSSSSLPTFFVFGILAGISSCAALVGGIILSLTKQWTELYSKNDSLTQRSQPLFLFNFGRLISYLLLGGILGLVGAKLQLSLTFTSFLVIAISVIMAFLGLQMLGLRSLRRFQFAAPKFITRRIANPENFSGKYMPFIMGGLTFFLPCGFTITAQGLALLSGSFFQGAMIMLAFALGTLPPLLFIGLASTKLTANHNFSTQFLKVAGILVLFFAVFNINNQLNVLGAPNISNLNLSFAKNNDPGVLDKDLPPIVSGKQILKMNASASGYSPKYLKVRVGVPVRWEVTDIGTSGCTNAIISKSLFPGQIDLVPGQTSIKEFTPQKTGKFKFSCWMGMVTGTIEVVDASAAAQSNSASAAVAEEDAAPSGATGCGCGHANNAAPNL